MAENSDSKPPFILGLAGGSGSGKSTIAYALRDRHPDVISVLRFDDYQVEDEERVPMYEGFRNWDYPACIEFKKLVADLAALKNGQAITVCTWGSRENPGYIKTRQRKEIVIQPTPVILVEGYLVLYDPGVRSLLDLSIYLEATDAERAKRRNKDAVMQDAASKGYNERVLVSMHEKYVASTKSHADKVLNTSELGLEEAVGEVEGLLPSVNIGSS